MDKPITVIVPTLSEETNIENCLKAVFNQTYKPCEVSVVDGYSKDGTAEITKQFPVEFVSNKYIISAGAYQVGLEQSHGEYLAFTEADCTPEKDCLKNLVKEFDQSVVGLASATKFELGNNLWVRSINLSLKIFIGKGDSI